MKVLHHANTSESRARSHDAARRPSMAERRAMLVDAEASPPIAARTSIYESVRPPPAEIPTSSEVLHQRRPPQQLSEELEGQVLTVILRPLTPDESHETGNANRERELARLFAGLTAAQAHDLGRRLDLDRPDDQLARAFGRLIIERRSRLRAFLREPRRHTNARR